MEINFFTTKPFTIDVYGKTYSLTKYEKLLVVIAGIAGLALLGVGAIFIFYGASYLLRKRAFKKIDDNDSKQSQIKISNLASALLNEKKVLIQMRANIIEITENLKPFNELESIQYFAKFYCGSIVTQSERKDLVASEDKSLREMLDKAILESFNSDTLSNSETRMEWSIIAKDKLGIFHGVIGKGGLSFKNYNTADNSRDFYRDIDPKNKDAIIEIISKKMNRCATNF